jgi:hypothetical protein
VEKLVINLFFEYIDTMKEHLLIHTSYKKGIDKPFTVAFSSLIVAVLSFNQKNNPLELAALVDYFYPMLTP